MPVQIVTTRRIGVKMSSFTTPLVLRYVDGREWEVVEAFEYHVGEYPSQHVIEVEEGFITDFASIPPIFWPILPPTGKYGKAAVIHDKCYSCKMCTRRKADDIFLEAMGVLNVGSFTKHTIYNMVRLFGWVAWKY
jgi:hypothetical protein